MATTGLEEANEAHGGVLRPFAECSDDRQSLAQFYAHKSVFVTGGTGFLGCVLIEALLSATPDIGKIFVLVRGKRGDNPENRIKKLLSKQIFDHHSEEAKSKVVPVVGELTAENFAFEDRVLKEIRENVQVIFHSAATIKFNEDLKVAIDINVLGTKRTLDLAKSLDHLAAYIYLSTAFCNSNYRGLIKEKVYSSGYDPLEMIQRSARNEFPPSHDPETKTIIGRHPNTYTFTKQLAETMINNEMKGRPVGIVRPSVVYGTYDKPVQGWVGNANSGHLGFLAGYVKGVFRTMAGRGDSVLDLIPCDYVINASLVMGWYVGQRKTLPEPEVIHCTSGERNPLTMANFCKTLNYCAAQHPCDLIVWKPHVQLRRSYRYTLFFYLFHILPSFIFYFPEMFVKKARGNMSTYKVMRVFDRGTKVFEFFTVKNFRYCLENSMFVAEMLRPEDRQLYSYDSLKCDWAELIARCFKGLRRYYFRESAETTAKHKIIWKIYELIHFLGFIGLFAVVFSLCMQVTSLQTAGLIASLVISFVLWL